MNCEIVTVIEPEFIRITPQGSFDVEDMLELVEIVRSEADKSGRTRVLMDCRRFAGSMTEADRFRGGQRVAEIFGGRLKAALLMPREQITKLGELAAVNRGAKFLVTDSEKEATKWLLGPG